MATYTNVVFEINNEHLQRFINGIASHYGYKNIIDGEPNPEAKADYGKRKIRQEWIHRVKRQEHIAQIEELTTDPIDVI